MVTEGIVVSKRRLPEAFEYIIFDGKQFHTLLSSKNVKSREVVLKNGDIEEFSTRNSVKERFFRHSSPSLSLPKDLEPLRDIFERVWKEIAFLKITGERTVIYHDSDADGVISALLLYEHLNASLRPITPWKLESMNNLDPELDAKLFLILDTGSYPTQRHVVEFLSKLSPTYVIDHHPGDLKDHIVAPSEYFTAYLVHLLVSGWNEKEEWVKVAAAGDRSSVVSWNEEHRRKALALELGLEVFRFHPNTMKSILDGDLWKPLWDEVERRFNLIEEMSSKEEYDTPKGKLLILSYEAPFSFPHRGKVASWFQEKGYHTVVVVGEHGITVRSEEPLLKRMSGFEAYGHPQAFTVRSENKEGVIEVIKHVMEDG